MPKKLFRNIFILVVANLLIKPIWIFGIDLQVQNMVGAADYGFYFIVFNFSFLFHVILDLGVNQFNNREVAQKQSFLQENFSKLVTLKIGFAILYFLVSFLLACLLGFNPLQQKMLLFLAWNQVLITFVLFARSNFTALQDYAWDAFFSVFDRVLAILFCLVLLFTSVFGDFNILYFIYAQNIALGISAFLSLMVLVWKGNVHLPSWSFKSLLPLFVKAFPYAVVIFLMTIYTRADAIMLDLLLDETANLEAGIYASSYRILDAINMIPFLFASLLIPYFAKQLKDQKNFTHVMWSAAKLLIAVSIPFLFIIALYDGEILSLLYQESDATWNPSFRLLLFTFPAVFITYIFGGFLTAAAKLKVISIFAILSILLNLLLNYFWIPEHGASGAALATLFTQILMAILQMIYVIRNWNTNFPLSMVWKFLIYLLGNTLFVMLLGWIYLDWRVEIFLFTSVAIILSLVLRLIDINKLKTL